jgi:predicted nucleotide-binding protein (sugar kinase/HSP70/actin superfamily)
MEMIKIKTLNAALKTFEDAAIQHEKATQSGDYKAANKAFKSINECARYFRENEEVEKLLIFLNHESVGVRVWSASYLLFSHESDAIKTLEEISLGIGIQSFNAQMTLKEWRKGTLKL